MANADLPCAKLVELVTDYLEGVLAAPDRARFEEHLTVCEGCVAYLEQIRATILLARRLRLDDFSPALQEELRHAFRGWRADSPG